MVQEDKDEASKIEDKKDLFVAKSSGHIESRTTENHNWVSRHPRYSNRQTLPVIVESEEMEGPRPQEKDYKSMGCKHVVKISSSAELFWHQSASN